MTTAADAITVAAAQLGVHEDPAGSNEVAYNTWWVQQFGGQRAVAWCLRWCTWVLWHAGLQSVVAQGTRDFARRARAAGRLTRTPSVGAIVLMFAGHKPGTGHAGLVEKIINATTFQTLEGNTDEKGGRTGGKVMRKIRTLDALGADGGFVAPAYDTPAPAPAAAPQPAPSRPTLRRGSKGNHVVYLQKMLGAHLINPGPEDGDFGPRVQRAVLQFQRSKGLAADGVVGPKTWAALG